ncbi:hypothetical protein VCJ71_07155 [Alteriqipengyuania sp. WL0013]|uniref:hypothetical protein n=1 Tax=Alteriqipengyuania sp. WL0013 TaxID=3110773 RepID=UPI002D1918D9|nr:hypothetical protein [Alteriqipengyuania sp. WL0013]MEB3415840.1 hypothetical protein [Alteriqipengyuania sp. WL0013]
MIARNAALAAIVLAATLGACRSSGDIVLEDGVGIQTARSLCPAVGVPDFTGDITTFNGTGRTLADMDVTATITNVRTTCDETGDQIYAGATFDVLARRTDTRGARSVQLPYFSTVLQAGRSVVSKQVGTVTVNFADGQERAQASGQAGAFVNRAAAALPADIEQEITRRRRPGEVEAAVDPLSKPEVRAAIARATFELLVGFQLDESQLRYNATR